MKPVSVCYRLQARSPFHLGERGVGLEESSVVLHSDTLFSALIIQLRELGEPFKDLIDAFPRACFPGVGKQAFATGNPPLRMSSAFPYSGNVLFFPKPLLRLAAASSPEPALPFGKSLKRIQFVSKQLYENWITGRKIPEGLIAMNTQGQSVEIKQLIQNGKVWLTPDERDRLGTTSDFIWREEVKQRVTVDRATSSSQVFSAGVVSFAEESGLFFLIDYLDQKWRPKIERSLRVLGEGGIGGERSIGYGKFDLQEAEEISVAAPEKPNAATILSYWYPTKLEVETGMLAGARYDLVIRRGWVASPEGMNLRRRGVRMLAEGAVIMKTPTGSLVDVRPLDPEDVPNIPHDIWRNGLAYSLPCRVEEG
ncbi:MAG: type III-A CRISPR-associated RAMP protein Csm4 [Anaerolineae bacterium]|nr:type III-A CRISPR-associated RAMP protein Csm4 [Anaerolineae bacterium]